MLEKRTYPCEVIPQELDFTRKITISGLIGSFLNTVGNDAHVLGFGTDALSRQNLGWVLSGMAIEMDSRPAEFSKYSIRTWVSSFSGLVSVRNIELLDEAGNCFGRGTSRWCLINYDTRRPVPMESLGPSMEDFTTPCDPPCPAPLRLKAVNTDPVAHHTVVYSDIDFNRHMNTLRYVDFMVDTLPIELLENSRPLRLDIHFSSESSYGQRLSLSMLSQGDTTDFAIRKEDGSVSCIAHFTWR